MKKYSFYIFYFLLFIFVSVFIRLWMSEVDRVNLQPVNAWTEDQQADCAIVLTGGPNRLSEGFDLLYQKHVRKLIVSGVNPDSHIEEIYPNIIFYGRLQPEDIILEKNSKTTYGNAQQTLPLVEALQCRDILLITSHLHMYRALSTFRAHFPETIKIYPRATIGKSYKHTWYQLFNESLKSLFYSFWAY